LIGAKPGNKMEKAKLNFLNEEDYMQNAQIAIDNLAQLNPIPLRLDLGKYFTEMKEIMPVFVKPEAEVMEPPKEFPVYGYSIVFGLKFDEKKFRKIFRVCKKL
jgi:hypothetical protein